MILPDHIHCILRLPPNDSNFSIRWKLIKERFTSGQKGMPNGGQLKVWQNRFWEHLLRDQKDWQCHMDYIYYNPVKHGYVEKPIEWPHTSFKKAIERGFYDPDWGSEVPKTIKDLAFE